MTLLTRPFSEWSIARKMLAITMIAGSVTLVAACTVFMAFDAVNVRSTMIREVETLCEIFGRNSRAALLFQDKQNAFSLFSALAASPYIENGCLYDDHGHIFAEYRRNPAKSCPTTIAKAGLVTSPTHLRISRVIRQDNDAIGSIVVDANLNQIYSTLLRFACIVALVLFGSGLLIFTLSYRLQRIVSVPIAALVETTRRVSEDQNYSLRAHKFSNDEIGTLVDSFNRMMVQILGQTEELKTATKRAEEMVRLKGEFLANMSHEIRTPLNGVIGMTQLALTTELTSEQWEYLHTIELSSHALLSIINDVLDFSKMEAGKMTLHPVEFSPAEIVQETMRTLASDAHAKGIELLCDVDPDVPAIVCADSMRVRQVLLNLVGNAVKFTQQGEVRVRVSALKHDALVPELQFSVIDTGIGIAPDHKQKIFEAFVQADGSMTRKYGGTGLGLAISSRLVNVMGGRLWVESKLSKGSEFHFTVSIAPVSVRLTSPLVFAHKRTLIVDDNAAHRQILHQHLTKSGLYVDSADHGRSAQEFLAHGHPYDVVLLDAILPDMSGFEIAAAVQANPATRGSVLMMLNSIDLNADTTRMRRLQIDSYLVKPIAESDLLKAVSAVLEANQQSRSLSRSKPAQPVAHANGVKVLLVEDNEVNQRLAVRMLSKLGYAVQHAGDGIEALQALERQRFDLVLMDVQMPQMDGFECARAIRAREHGKDRVPIIAMTANAMPGDEENCLEAGMDGYMAKPVRWNELEGTLASIRNSRLLSPSLPLPVTLEH